MVSEILIWCGLTIISSGLIGLAADFLRFPDNEVPNAKAKKEGRRKTQEGGHSGDPTQGPQRSGESSSPQEKEKSGRAAAGI
jgi:hypothetical protein